MSSRSVTLLGRLCAATAGPVLGCLVGLIASAPLARAAHMVAWAIPTHNAQPYIVVVAPDQTVWFSESGVDRIGRLDARDGHVREFPLPTVNSRPIGLTVGPRGDIWFAESAGNRVGRITRAGAIQAWECPTPNAGPNGMYTDSHGTVWFSEGTADRIASVAPDGRITEYADGISHGGSPLSLTERDAQIWFSEANGDRLARLHDGRSTEIQLDHGTQPRAMIEHPDGSLWFVATGIGQLARLDAAGHIRYFPVPSRGASLRSLAVAPNGNIWFTEDGVNKIGVISPAGRVLHEYRLIAPMRGLRGIAVDARGHVFFAAVDSGHIGELVP